MTTDLVRCPQCEQGRVRVPAGRGAQASCDACAAVFPFPDGVLDLLPPVRERRSLWQQLMESETIVSIYESRLWRRSVVAHAIMGMDFEHEQALVLEAAAPTASSHVLDLACGSGIYTRPLAQQAGIVVGLDLSWPMLRYASRRVRDEHIDNVRLVRGNALQLPFADGTFDVTNCCGALHLFPDPPRVLEEIARVLRPGGRFTCAAAQRSESRSQEIANQFGRTYTGLHAFRRQELGGGMERAGFDEVRCHFSTGRWMILSGRK